MVLPSAPKVLPRFSQVVLLLLVARLLDSRLRFARFSEGSTTTTTTTTTTTMMMMVVVMSMIVIIVA